MLHFWSQFVQDRQADRILQKFKSELSHILHHTAHITYCMWICKFFKIVMVLLEVIFKKLSRMSLRFFVLLKIIVSTMPTHWSSLKLVKQHISWWKTPLSKENNFPEIFLGSKTLFFPSLKVIKKLWVIKNPRHTTSRVFQNGQRVCFRFFL